MQTLRRTTTYYGSGRGLWEGSDSRGEDKTVGVGWSLGSNTGSTVLLKKVQNHIGLTGDPQEPGLD